nr:ATP-binding cassette domain-containing protein [Ktedonosporobacter rubrisoli]
MRNIAIQVKGLQKSYKKLKVLQGANFTVERGSIFALLGSNGAGKTTLVKILTTLLKQDGGTAMINDFDVASQPELVRQSLSLTGQFAAVDEILTGRENLILIARLRHLTQPRQVADELLAGFGLTEAANRRASTYSGGMRRRLDLAMSLVGTPPILFLDEPTTGLDPQARIEVWKVVKELASSGITVFLTTQYLDEAEQLADRIAKGKIIASGTLAELKRLFPPAQVEYVEKQPSLEEIFLGASAFCWWPTSLRGWPIKSASEKKAVGRKGGHSISALYQHFKHTPGYRNNGMCDSPLRRKFF